MKNKKLLKINSSLFKCDDNAADDVDDVDEQNHCQVIFGLPRLVQIGATLVGVLPRANEEVDGPLAWAHVPQASEGNADDCNDPGEKGGQQVVFDKRELRLVCQKDAVRNCLAKEEQVACHGEEELGHHLDQT